MFWLNVKKILSQSKPRLSGIAGISFSGISRITTPFLTARPGSNISPRCAPVSLGCNPGQWSAGRTVKPSQSIMKALVRVEISTLESEWGALQVHGKGDNYFPKFQWGRHKLSIFHWVLRSIASGLHYFPKISRGAPRCTPMHPRCTPAGALS